MTKLSQISAAGSTPALLDTLVGVTSANADRRSPYTSVMGPVRGWISGLTLSNDGTTPNTIIDIAAGCATSDDFSNFMSTAGINKSINSTWAVGTGNGGLDTGTVAASTWYHVFLIMRTDTGVVDALISTSASSPTMPANYGEKRRIGSIRTDASKHIIPFTQFGDEFLWKTVTLDANFTASSASQTLNTLTVPTGVQVFALLNLGFFYNGANLNLAIYTPDMGDQSAAAWINADDTGILTRSTFPEATLFVRVRTNTSAQVAWATNGTGTQISIETMGWIDIRGKI